MESRISAEGGHRASAATDQCAQPGRVAIHGPVSVLNSIAAQDLRLCGDVVQIVRSAAAGIEGAPGDERGSSAVWTTGVGAMVAWVEPEVGLARGMQSTGACAYFCLVCCSSPQRDATWMTTMRRD